MHKIHLRLHAAAILNFAFLYGRHLGMYHMKRLERTKLLMADICFNFQTLLKCFPTFNESLFGEDNLAVI